MATGNEQVAPKVVLIPHARSHPFAQRDCSLNEPLKVGRSVDKKRISHNNLIFDCRVLSRNHALIWFENGKVSELFYATENYLVTTYYHAMWSSFLFEIQKAATGRL